MPHNRGTRRKPNFVGAASYKGRRKWVSGCASVAEYNEALKRARNELREQVENPDAKRVPTVYRVRRCSDRRGRPDLHESGPTGSAARSRLGRRDSSVRAHAPSTQAVPAGVRGATASTASAAMRRSPGPARRASTYSSLCASSSTTRPGADPRNQFPNSALTSRSAASNGPTSRSSPTSSTRGSCMRPHVPHRRLRARGRGDSCVGEAAIRPSEIFALHKDEVDLRRGRHRCALADRLADTQARTDQGRRSALGRPQPAARAHLELSCSTTGRSSFPRYAADTSRSPTGIRIGTLCGSRPACRSLESMNSSTGRCSGWSTLLRTAA